MKVVTKKVPAHKQAPGPATPERAPKGKAWQAPKKAVKAGQVAGQKQLQKNKPASKVKGARAAAADSGRTGKAPTARRSSRRGSAK